jgi:hypothetical protein
MVNFCAICGCCTRTDIVREHLEDTLRICDVSAMGLYGTYFENSAFDVFIVQKLWENEEFLSQKLVCKIHSRVHDSWAMGSDRVRDVPNVDRV